MKNKIVVYTALFGNYSGLIEQPIYDNIDYICYTDQELQSKSWNVIKVEPPIEGDNTRSNRFFKILPHKQKELKNYDQSVYIDANYLIIADFTRSLKSYLKNYSMLCFDHNQTVFDKRDCIYKEYHELMEMAHKFGVYRDDPIAMTNQINFFKKENYPINNGLIFAAVLTRNHNDPKVIELMELWWSFVKNGSKRDQLSFNYCVWKTNFKKLKYLTGDLRSGNPWFYWFDRKLDFKKEIKKLKINLFLKKYLPLYFKIIESEFYRVLKFYIFIPYTLIKVNKWFDRYTNSKLTPNKRKKLRRTILNNHLSKKEIINLIENENSL